ncbi:MAG: chemotaxis protein CheA [Candidatus Bathyarchaeia archaeon]
MSFNMDQYKQLFIEEAKEHIDNLTRGLLIVEKDPGNIDAINVLFRSAHTLKGSSAMMGFKDIAELTHKMEDVLDGIRKSGRVSSELVNILLECVDALTCRLDKLQNGIDEEIDIASLMEKLNRFQVIEDAKPQERIEDKKDAGNDSRESEGQIYQVDVKLSSDCIFRALRACMIIDRLSEKGEVLKTFPSKEDIERDNVGHEIRILIRSNVGDIDLRKCVESICEVESVSIMQVRNAEEFTNHGRACEQREDSYKPMFDTRISQTVRIHFKHLDKLMNLVGELVINKIALLQAISSSNQEYLKRVAGSIDRLVTELQDLVTRIRMVPVSQIFDRFPRLVRDLSLKKNKKVELLMEGREIEVDRTVLDEIGEPLVHLIRNCIDHGIEPPEERIKYGKNPVGLIRLVARREGDHVLIEVEDDGAGIDPEKIKRTAIERGFLSLDEVSKMSREQLINLVFIPGFSTAKQVTETSGRGVGMDVVKTKIESLGGFVSLKTEVGKGTKVTLKLPLTVAIIKSLLVNVAGQIFAIPSSQVSEVIRIDASDIKSLGMMEVIEVRGHVIPLLRLSSLLNLNSGEAQNHHEVIVTNADNEGRCYGLVVDSVLRLQEILIKPLDSTLSCLKEFSGATILGDGQVVLVLDIPKLISKRNAERNQERLSLKACA